MPGDVVQIRQLSPGNGAREALTEYFRQDAYAEYLAGNPDPTLTRADHLLAWLWVAGYKVDRLP